MNPRDDQEFTFIRIRLPETKTAERNLKGSVRLFNHCIQINDEITTWD